MKIIEQDGVQMIALPADFRFDCDEVTIRRSGNNTIFVQPIKQSGWPPGFFESIAVDDLAFERPDQGTMPPAPKFD